MPCAPAAVGHPERDLVVEPVAEHLRADDAHPGGLIVANVAGILDKEEDGDDGRADGAQGPPEDIIPRPGLGDEAAQRAATDDGEDDSLSETAKDLPRRCRKNMSMMYPLPRMAGMPPKKPQNSREMVEGI